MPPLAPFCLFPWLTLMLSFSQNFMVSFPSNDFETSSKKSIQKCLKFHQELIQTSCYLKVYHLKKKKKAPFIFTQIIKTISKTFPWECHGSKIFLSNWVWALLGYYWQDLIPQEKKVGIFVEMYDP